MIHFLHGAVGDPSDWDECIGMLDGVDMRAVDIYGEKILPFDRFATSLNATAAPGDSLVGYSMGGRLALHAMVQPDAPWSKAVIVSADPGHGEDAERLALDAGWAALAREDWSRFCVEWAKQPVFGGAAMPWDRGEVPPVRREAVAEGFEEWTVGRQRDLRHELKCCEADVLWIVGEDDVKFLRLAECILPVIRNKQLAVVAGAGHRVPWDQPEVFSKAIQSFLS